jgi:regulatory protein
VVQELKAKGVDADAVAQAAATLKTTEHERAVLVWRKKFGAEPTDSDRMKQMRFLASRGFAPDVIRRVVGGGMDQYMDGDD